jgi:hypothetical protein
MASIAACSSDLTWELEGPLALGASVSAFLALGAALTGEVLRRFLVSGFALAYLCQLSSAAEPTSTYSF